MLTDPLNPRPCMMPLSQTDQVEYHRFESLIWNGAVTYAHRKMDAWLRQTNPGKLYDKRQAAVNELKTRYPAPVPGK